VSVPLQRREEVVGPVTRDRPQLSEVSDAFAHLVDLAPVLMWVSGPDGACNYFNETWLKFTGLTLPQASGWGWLECIHPADTARWAAERAQYTSGARTHMPFRVEYRLRRSDGQYRWIDAQGTPRFDGAGNFLGFVGCGVDVTERAEAEVEIGEWKARYDAAARASGQVLYEWERARDHIIWSGSSEHVFGYPPSAIRTRAEWMEKVHPEDRSRIDAGIEDFLRLGVAEPVSYRVIRPDGSYVVIEARRLGLRNASGEITRVIGFLTDITERRRLEREVIEVANREQVRIGNDLHDGLGQELAGIALLMKSIGSQAHGSNPQLTADLSTVTELVNHAVASCRELAQTSRQVYGLECTVTCERGVSQRLTEQQAYQLYRIAQEAVSNAGKHSRGQRIEIRLDVSGPKVRLTVTDDGRGVSEKAIAAANGMGLRTMRYRAAMVGALLEVEAVPPGGTRVTCSLFLDSRADEESRTNARRKMR
jgi:PAS domain S-box-containing protein